MVIAYNLAMENPDRVDKIIALNPNPPQLTRKDALAYAPGMFRTAVLANIFAPNTARLIAKFGVKRVNWTRNIDELDKVTAVRTEGASEAFEKDYFETFLAPNFRDLGLAKGEGTWRDVSYHAKNWAKLGDNINSRPKTTVLYHKDFPVVTAAHVSEFCGKINANFVVIAPPFGQLHRHLGAVCEALRQEA
jgi:pimeloyl-ACP methyl ester carboxylesterase